MRPSPALKPITSLPSTVETGRPPAPETGARARVAVAVALHRAYKVLISPLFTGSCRFQPSCADYARDAVIAHGVLRGGWLGLRRLARCHPFGGHGFDPVPAGATDRQRRS
jgi:uncharacterized protein